MNIEGQVTILVSGESVQIEIRDRDAAMTFAKIEMTPGDFTAALGRLSNVKCSVSLRGLDKVGLKQQVDTIEFEMPDAGYPGLAEVAYELAKGVCKEGWCPDKYFGSQNSFFQKEGKQYARATIRRWVEKEEIGAV